MIYAAEHKKRYYHSHRRTRIGRYCAASFDQKAVEALFYNGYEMTRDDLKFTIENRIEIERIERFNLKFDDEVFRWCLEKKFFPEYNFKTADPIRLGLYKICITSGLKGIKNYIEENKIEPDDECMKYVSNNRAKINVVNYFMEKGLTLTNSELLSMIDNHSAFRNNSYSSSFKNILAKQLTRNNTGRQSEQSQHSQQNSQIDDSLLEISDEDELDVIVEMDSSEYKYPKSTNRKVVTPPLYKDFFDEKKVMMTFDHLKENFIKRCQERSWINEDKNEGVKTITLPENLALILNLDHNVISFGIVDELVRRFFTKKKNAKTRNILKSKVLSSKKYMSRK